jgi:hypothetical protein
MSLRCVKQKPTSVSRTFRRFLQRSSDIQHSGTHRCHRGSRNTGSHPPHGRLVWQLGDEHPASQRQPGPADSGQTTSQQTLLVPRSDPGARWRFSCFVIALASVVLPSPAIIQGEPIPQGRQGGTGATLGALISGLWITVSPQGKWLAKGYAAYSERTG